MIDYSKIKFTSTPDDSRDSLCVAAELRMAAFMNISNSELLGRTDDQGFAQRRDELFARIKLELTRRLFKDVYFDLLNPLHELFAKAMSLARENNEVRETRELIQRIEKLLEYPK